MERTRAKSSRDCDVINNCVRTVAADVEPPIATRWWDSNDENDIANEECWKLILGAPISCWNKVELTKSNSILLGPALEDAEKYKKDVEEYHDQIKELNGTLNEDEKFSYVEIRPRFPRPTCLYPWYKMSRMKNTNPTAVRSKQFTKPGASEYMETSMLQFFSLRFAGDFLHDNPMRVYGFLAIRDDIDYLRNHVFLQSREHAYEISQDSRSLPLILPTRGVHAPFGVLVEYSIKAVDDASNHTDNDDEIIDGCFEFRNAIFGTGSEKYKARIYGPFGPMDIGFGLIMHAVEATIDVKITGAAKGSDLKTVTAFTSGFHDEILLYDGSSRSPVASKDDLPLLVVESSVVAVELHGELKLAFDISSEDESGCGFYTCRQSKGSVGTYGFSFTSKKYKSSKRAIVIGRMLKLVVNITWSTFGEFDNRFPRKYDIIWLEVLIVSGQVLHQDAIFLYFSSGNVSIDICALFV